MEVEELLVYILENLVDQELKKFQWHCMLKKLDSRKPIPKSYLDKATREETVSKLIDAYGEKVAVSLTVEVLQKMYKNSLAEELEDKYAAPSSSSAQGPPAAAAAAAAPGAPGAPGPSIVAQQGSTVVMLTPTSSTTGAINVNINKPDN